MKRLLSLVVIVLACKAAAWAQPSLIFPPAAPNAGEQFCVDVKVKDFTDILSMEFSLQWDPQVIQFERVEGFGLPSFSDANFNKTLTAEGKLSVSWVIAQCSATAVGVTTPDGTSIFRLCFKALADYGESSEITLAQDPLPIRVTRVNACPNNIGMISKNGLVSIGVRPLTLIATQETAAKTGDLVCVDYKVTGFDDLTSMQFSTQWDPAILDFVNVQGLENLINLAPSNFGTPDMESVGPGKLTLSWSYVDPTDPGVSLPDSTTIFQACFRVKGACETSTSIDFIDSPTPFEFTNTVVEGYELKVLTESGKVSVGVCDPVGLKLFADCGAPANPNEEVCVKITTAGFQNIREFSYNLEWNEKILEYVGVRNVNNAIVGFDFPGDFDVSNQSNGVLGVRWSTNSSLGVSLPGGAGNMFEVCFKVIGVEGGSPVNFTGPSKVVTFNNPNLGINPSNCAVEIVKPQGVVMTLTDTEAPLGDTACVDIRVANFNNITSYQFSLAWEPNHMTFVGIKNNAVNLPEASIANVGLLGVDGGALTFEWDPSRAYSVADNTVLFQVCYEMTGTPQDCDALQLVDQPLEAEALNTTSNGNNIGVVSQPAEICILFPEGFYLDIDSLTADTGTVACLPVKVSSFDNITSAKFPISWEPSALEFIGVQNPNVLPGLSNASFDITSTGVGVLNVNWSNATPANVADSTVIFELCYNLVGSPDNCYEVRVGEPDPIVTTANGGGSMLSDPGEICIRGRLTVQDTIIKSVSCPGTNDGEITLVVSGGKGPIGFTWEAVPRQFGPTARNLPAGLVAVTIFDNSSPALILKDTFEIPMNMDLPTANAGVDKDFTCNPPIVPLQGQGSQGANFSYRWTTADGQLAPNVTTLNSGALAPGSYILEVINDETGCVARDTARILPVGFPTADAGANRDFSCDTETLQLDGSASSSGAGIRYKWTATAGGAIMAGQDTLQSPAISAPGTYIIAVTNSASGCISRDSVQIRNIQVFPNANAGADVELPCGDDAAIQLVSQSNNPEAVSTQWLDLNGQVVSDSITFTAKQTGDYILRITNPSNNCSALDTIKIKPSALSPVIALDSLKQLTCSTDTLTLSANISNTSNYIFQWTANNGGQFVSGTESTLSPRIALPGAYELLVRDTATKCETTSLVLVEDNKVLPTAVVGAVEELTCQDGERELDGTGSSTGADFGYAWKLNGNTIATDTLKTKINAPGTYYLDVTNKINGCVATDSVVVAASIDRPTVVVPIELPNLSCKDSTVTITATTNASYSIEWTPSDGGNIISGQNTNTIVVNSKGNYQIKVINPVNGCEGTADAVVEADTTKPVAIAGEDQQITCQSTAVTLNGNNSSVGSDFTYQWRAVNGGQTPSPNNAPQVSVSTPGMYELVVTNTRNNCVATDQVMVAKNDTLPRIAFATPDSISCRDSMARIDASATTPNAAISVQWNGLDSGVPQLTNNPLIIDVTQGGRYELLVTNNANSCVAKDTIEVITSKDIPQLNIATPAQLTCTQPSTALDATASAIKGNFTASWSTVSGGTIQANPNAPLRATANGAGTYQLNVTVSATGCTASTEITINNPEYPMANAAADKPTIGCGERATLNSAGSSSGTGINYRWSVVNGTGTIANPTAQNIQVDKAGAYQLIVTNTANGCTDTTLVNIAFNVQFESANAGADLAVCAPNANLTANLPAGTTGQWKSLSGVSIAIPTQASIAVNNLKLGDNRFVWALSATGCGEYSADTVAVKVESAPAAADDAFTLKAGETRGTIFVTGNDNLSNVNTFTVSITENPLRGGIVGVSDDGKVGYQIKAGLFGQDEFKYKLCSTTCPSYCDSALVSILIEEDPNFEAPPRTNAITPNGDGLNEQLFFEELQINADQYPDNELIVFNRWGDIVYTARPYANNWDGTTETGQNLPEGTYYYILRLNISEGIIIRGDVTIVR